MDVGQIGAQLGRSPDDAGLIVEFEMHPVEMTARSEQEGRPIFEDRAYITIRAAGSTLQVVSREVGEADKRRFPVEWARFNAGEKDVIDGTPLKEWPAITRSRAMELAALNIRTLEELVAVQDGFLPKLGIGARELRTKAKAYLEAAADSAVASRLAAEGERKDGQIADLQRQIAELGAMCKDLTARLDGGGETEPAKRGPGRPRKDAEAA